MNKLNQMITINDNEAENTLVTFLLDQSGSMGMLQETTIEAYNEYVGTLREEEANIRFTLITFSSMSKLNLDIKHMAEPMANIPDMSPVDFKPGGMTPLYDAVAMTIEAVEKSVEGKENIRVVVAIQTDGYENSSRKTNLEKIRSLISNKKALGWEFIFMGCDMDAYRQGENMGFKKEQILSYQRGRPETKAAFRAVAENTREYAHRRRSDMFFSTLQKEEAGDNELNRRRYGYKARTSKARPNKTYSDNGSCRPSTKDIDRELVLEIPESF